MAQEWFSISTRSTTIWPVEAEDGRFTDRLPLIVVSVNYGLLFIVCPWKNSSFEGRPGGIRGGPAISCANRSRHWFGGIPSVSASVMVIRLCAPGVSSFVDTAALWIIYDLVGATYRNPLEDSILLALWWLQTLVNCASVEEERSPKLPWVAAVMMKC